MKPFIYLAAFALFITGCSSAEVRKPSTESKSSGPVNTAPEPTPQSGNAPKNGDYPAKGKITKINAELKSVELDHEDIPGVMPKMIMEFYVVEPAKIDGLKVGDEVDFTLRYDDHREYIVAIKKSK